MREEVGDLMFLFRSFFALFFCFFFMLLFCSFLYRFGVPFGDVLGVKNRPTWEFVTYRFSLIFQWFFNTF